MRGSELAVVEIYNLALSLSTAWRWSTLLQRPNYREQARDPGHHDAITTRKPMQCCAVLVSV